MSLLKAVVLILLFTSSQLILSPMATAEHFATQRQHSIFLLFSYHPSFPTSQKVIAGLQEAFGKDMPDIDIEFMDSKRLYDETSQAKFLDMLKYKLSFRDNYTIVITVDDNALDFALTHRDELFPTAEVVFLGVNDINKAASLEHTPWITGVVEAASFQETIDLSTRLMPERNHLSIIVDGRKSGQADLVALRDIQNRFSHVVFKELSLTRLSWTELASELALHDLKDSVLLLSAYQDALGEDKSFDDSLAFIKRHSTAPILHLWEHGIGEGALGGVVVSHTEQGHQAGLMVKQILNGGKADDIPILMRSPNIPTFDYRQLAKLKLNSADFPANTHFWFKPNAIWQSYQLEISSVALAFLVLVISALYLIRKNLQMKRLNSQVMEKTSYLRLLMDTSPDLVWLKDPEGKYLSCNKRTEELFNQPESHLIGKHAHEFLDPSTAKAQQVMDNIAIQSREKLVYELNVTFLSDGHKENLEIAKTPVYDPVSGDLLGILGIARDITDRRAAEEANRLAASVFANTAEGIIITNADVDIVEVNPAFTEITGYRREEVIGKNPRLLQSGLHDSNYFASIWESLNSSEQWKGELLNQRKDGDVYPSLQTITAVKNERDEIVNYVSVFTDISSIKESQREVQHLAYHDPLTNLPNRLLLKEHLEKAILHADRHLEPFALVFLDLDNFKNINDSFGHTEGDNLLRSVALMLKDTIRGEDTIARVGGDEFVILLDDLQKTENAEIVARKILNCLQEPIQLDNQLVNISASLGVCVYPQDGENADELLRNADSAMYRAKQQGRNNFQLYTREITQKVIKRVQIENHLRRAIERNELSLYYQPQINQSTGQLIGAEALLRWHHPEHGMIPPTQFIPIAEECGLICSIGEWVLNTAAKQARIWLDKHYDIGRIAINISGQHIQLKDLVHQVKKALEDNQLLPKHLALEVTETFIVQNKASSISKLKELKEMGIELAIDDFGTGYSSLSYLKRLPVHKLKIDRSFICDIPKDEDDMMISRAIIALAESLRLQVIAEGVETEEQASFLEKEGCHLVQGYLYSKPLPVQELEAFYLANTDSKLSTSAPSVG